MTNIIGLGQDNAGKVINSRSLITEELGIQRLTEITTVTTYSAGLSSIAGGGSNVPAIYSVHPEFPNMSVEAVSVSNKTGGLAEIVTQYVGFTNGIKFYWPPDIIPTGTGSIPLPPGQNVVPYIRLFPAGKKMDQFGRNGDWLHCPVIVQITFIDTVEHEELLYSDWIVGATRVPSEFRGKKIPQSSVSPYISPLPNPIPDGFVQVIYYGVVLSSINVDRRGGLYNEIRLTFKDEVKTVTYNVVNP